MSVAAQEVGVLKRLMETRVLDADPLKGLGRFFFSAIQDYLAAPRAVSEATTLMRRLAGNARMILADA
jgi:hypothetical protein